MRKSWSLLKLGSWLRWYCKLLTSLINFLKPLFEPSRNHRKVIAADLNHSKNLPMVSNTLNRRLRIRRKNSNYSCNFPCNLQSQNYLAPLVFILRLRDGMVDITDLKSVEPQRSCRFKSGRRYHFDIQTLSSPFNNELGKKIS